ncbi:MAG TPA: HAMP domain-containing sensor histidine kinase [Vicinamibacteria bacterium]
MADTPRLGLRLALAGALALLALAQLQLGLHVLRLWQQAPDRAVSVPRELFQRDLPELALLFDSDAMPTALDGLRLRAGALAVEAFDLHGQIRSASGTAPVAHWLAEADLERVRSGSFLALAPKDAAGHLLAYAAVPAREPVVIRFAWARPDLLEDRRRQRDAAVISGSCALALLLLSVLALVPDRTRRPPLHPADAAYLEALARLRDHGFQEADRHDAERDRLERAMRDREPFVRAGEISSSVIHEVRNGLGAIVAYARLIEGGPAGPDARQAAAAIRAECDALEHVVRRFVELLRDEAPRPAPFDLGRMLGRVAAREARTDETATVHLEGGACPVEGDEDLLERAFENLVRNARQAAGTGGHVWLGWSADAERARVTIRDDGPGLPAGAPPPLQSSKPGGLGLGVALAGKLVRLHGGTLAFEPNPPRGAKVTVTLPVRVTVAATDGNTGADAAPVPRAEVSG